MYCKDVEINCQDCLQADYDLIKKNNYNDVTVNPLLIYIFLKKTYKKIFIINIKWMKNVKRILL